MDIHVDLVMKNRLYSEGIVSGLSSLDDKIKIQVQAITEPCSCFIDRLKEENKAPCSDVVLVDGEIDDIPLLIRGFKRSNPCLKTILFVPSFSTETINDCLSLGVEGLISANDGLRDLRHCIYTVFSGRLCYPAFSAHGLRAGCGRGAAPMDNKVAVPEVGLTKRQTKVVELIGSGFSNKEIARELDIELSTVKNHVHQILSRLNAKSRCEAVALYRRTTRSFFLSMTES